MTVEIRPITATKQTASRMTGVMDFSFGSGVDVVDCGVGAGLLVVDGSEFIIGSGLTTG